MCRCITDKSLLLLLVLALSAMAATCFAAGGGPVRIWNTHGSSNERKWTLVTGTPNNLPPEHVALENGLIRLNYPCKFGPAAKPSSNEKAGHVLYVKTARGYVLAQDPEFGDWTYVGGSVTDTCAGCRIIRNTADVAEIALSFPDHKMTAGDSSANPFTKRIILRKGLYGYTVKMDVSTAAVGEREVGFGLAASTMTGRNSGHLFHYSTKFGVLWSAGDHSENMTDYRFLRDEGQPEGDWWAAAMSFDRSYLRIVALKPSSDSYPPALRSFSFPKNRNIGGLIRYTTTAKASADYDAFIAAVPYDGRNANRIKLVDGKAVISVPSSGHYTVFSKQRTDKRVSYNLTRVIEDVYLRAGTNRVAMNGMELDHPVVVPLTNGSCFPADIADIYRRLSD